MLEKMYDNKNFEEIWYHYMECGMPMAGPGGGFLRLYGSAPSNFNLQFGSAFERFARKKESGAEVELSMMFADMRDSTTLANLSQHLALEI